MFNIAIVEDQQEERDLLKSFFGRYAQECGKSERFNVSEYESALNFLSGYKANFDIVFMDIVLPDLNGMEAAKALRKLDKRVPLIFCTNMAQYAVRGYEVGAYDFIVKPITYSNFKLKLQRVIDYVYESRGRDIRIATEGGCVCLNILDIKYIEVMAHRVIYHTLHGNYSVRDTLKHVEESLASADFVRCNNCYLVNLHHVSAVRDMTCCLGKEELAISYPKRKEFIRALNDYFGGGRGV